MRVCRLLILLACLCALNGCGLLFLGAAGVVGVTAITVKTGVDLTESAATTTGRVASGTVRAGKSGLSAVVNTSEVSIIQPGDVLTVHAATRKTVTEMRFRTTKSSSDAASGQVLAKTRDGSDIAIALKAVDAGHTRVTVRVGVIGDQSIAQLLQDRIGQELQATP